MLLASHNMGEVERMTRRYTAELIEFIGPEKDVPAPDVNTNEQIMAWFMDTYSVYMGYAVNEIVTGKPVAIGGTEGRREATGRGVVYLVERAMNMLKMDPEKCTAIVQGFGNVGSHAARLMAAGAQMVKLEGGAWLAPTVEFLVARGIPVCGHLGLQPQSVHRVGGYRAQGKTEASARVLREDAQALAIAGIELLVLEMVPDSLPALARRQESLRRAFGREQLKRGCTGLERIDITIVPLVPYADALMITRGALRSLRLAGACGDVESLHHLFGAGADD